VRPTEVLDALAEHRRKWAYSESKIARIAVHLAHQKHQRQRTRLKRPTGNPKQPTRSNESEVPARTIIGFFVAKPPRDLPNPRIKDRDKKTSERDQANL
jgi:hypothetical protein